jgi:hypothetical protein
MLIERLALDAIREPLHHQRAVLDDRKDERRDACVIAQQVALAVARLRPEDFLQVGDVEPVTIGQQEPPVTLPVFELLQLCGQRVRMRRPRNERVAA